jgi:uncharacterized protein
MHVYRLNTRALGRFRRLSTVHFAALVALILVATTLVHAQSVTIPRITEYVTDEAGTLSPGVRQALNDSLAAFDKATSTQIVVVILPTIGIEALEEVSLRIVEQNGVGRKGKDNGVLLLVVRDDRKLRIEVGYGLEGVLTDALTAQIIRKEIVPHFRIGDYDSGIVAGVSAIQRATRNEYTADPSDTGSEGFNSGTIFFILFVLFVLSRLFSRLSSRRGRRGGFPLGGGWGGGSWGGGGGFGGGGFSGGGGSFGGGGSSGSW